MNEIVEEFFGSLSLVELNVVLIVVDFCVGFNIVVSDKWFLILVFVKDKIDL